MKALILIIGDDPVLLQTRAELLRVKPPGDQVVFGWLREVVEDGLLQEEIERLESMIADRRELYNDQVYRYNTRIAQVPAVLLAGLFGWRARQFFEVPDADRRRPDADLRADPNPQPD